MELPHEQFRIRHVAVRPLFQTWRDVPLKFIVRAKADLQIAPAGVQFPLPTSHILIMTTWQPPKREPAKTKAELREMLAEAVRNTQAENKRLQKAKKVKAV